MDERSEELVRLAASGDARGYLLKLEELSLEHAARESDIARTDELCKDLKQKLEPLEETLKTQKEELNAISAVSNAQSRLLQLAKQSFRAAVRVELPGSQSAQVTLDQSCSELGEKKRQLEDQCAALQRRLASLQQAFDEEMMQLVVDEQQQLQNVQERISRVKENRAPAP